MPMQFLISHALKTTLKQEVKEMQVLLAIAKDRPKWRQQTHSKPKPPDA